MSLSIATNRGIRVNSSTRGQSILVITATIVMGLFVLFAIFGEWIAPHPPNATDFTAINAGPSAEYWLGTDSSGRDLLSRIIVGTRSALIAPALIVVLSTLLGLLVGVAAGWFGGRIDWLLSRATDVLLAFPGLLIAILAVAIFGKGLLGPVIGMGIAYAPVVARLARSLVVAERSKTYVSAYHVQGFSQFTVVVTKVLPNIFPVLLGQAVINFGYAMFEMAALSFLGLGVQPPTADWGAMVALNRDGILIGNPLPAIAPGIAIVIVIAAVNILATAYGQRASRRAAT